MAAQALLPAASARSGHRSGAARPDPRRSGHTHPLRPVPPTWVKRIAL